jgi:hypothetical protein
MHHPFAESNHCTSKTFFEIILLMPLMPVVGTRKIAVGDTYLCGETVFFWIEK